MRQLLRHEPSVRATTPAELLAFAAALEVEAVRRYGQLADLMHRRGMAAPAATFRALAEVERDHVDGVAAWARSLGEALPDPQAFTWALPREIAESWDELTDRTRITPYQALAVAVLNEMRAFAVYSYIAGTTADAAARRAAERLALEELGHAALLRRQRRRAFRDGWRDKEAGAVPLDAAALRARLCTLASTAASRHRSIAMALEAAGDGESAALLNTVAAEEAALAGVDPIPDAGPARGSVPELLREALGPGEVLSEAMGDAAMAAGDEAVLEEAQRVQEIAVGHLARLSARLVAVERGDAMPSGSAGSCRPRAGAAVPDGPGSSARS